MVSYSSRKAEERIRNERPSLGPHKGKDTTQTYHMTTQSVTLRNGGSGRDLTKDFSSTAPIVNVASLNYHHPLPICPLTCQVVYLNHTVLFKSAAST